MLLSLAFITALTITYILTCPLNQEKTEPRLEFGSKFDGSYTLLVQEKETKHRPWDPEYIELEDYMDDDWQDLIDDGKTTYGEQQEIAEKRIKKAKETYNPIQITIKQQYWKRNLTAKRWQAGNTPDTAFVIEKPNEKGEIMHYYGWDRSGMNYKCRKYEVHCLSTGESGQFFHDGSYRLINTLTEGNKMYLQYHYYSYDEELDWSSRTFWTTVYDKETGSYLPYKKDMFIVDYDNLVTIYNTTYIPTQLDWIKLPDDC